MKQKTLKLTKTTIADLDNKTMNTVQAGKPFSRKPTQCETYIPLCIEETVLC
jgi:hypothetical protein